MIDRLRWTLPAGMLALVGPTPVAAHGLHASVGQTVHGLVHGVELLALTVAALWLGRRLLRSARRSR